MEPIAQPATPDPDVIRERAAEILSRSDYRIDTESQGSNWFSELLSWILDWISVPLRWLFGMTEGLPYVLRWVIVIGAFVLLVLLVAHMVYSLVSVARSSARYRSKLYESRPRELNPDELEREAESAVAKADFITAIRLLFRADVIRIERFEKRPNRPGTTNRELLYRYRHLTDFVDALRLLVDTIDRKWYGDEVCSNDDFLACRDAHDRLRSLLERAPDAVGA